MKQNIVLIAILMWPHLVAFPDAWWSWLDFGRVVWNDGEPRKSVFPIRVSLSIAWTFFTFFPCVFEANVAEQMRDSVALI